MLQFLIFHFCIYFVGKYYTLTKQTLNHHRLLIDFMQAKFYIPFTIIHNQYLQIYDLQKICELFYFQLSSIINSEVLQLTKNELIPKNNF